ncbi:hypothetical protein AC1031_004490 [Aphanomyces cochlioides]|nr:hypothetical protein AC1031_004490 [Aphanomyces cochlioides]
MVFKSKRALQLERARKAPRKKPKNDDLAFQDQDVMEPGMAEAHTADLAEDDSSEEDELFMDTRPVDQADSSKWFISYKEEAAKHQRFFYDSSSRTTMWRNKTKNDEAAKRTFLRRASACIDQFLHSQDIRVFLKSTSSRAEVEPIDDINRAIEFLHDIVVAPITSSKSHPTLSAHDLKRYLAVHMYLCARLTGELMIAASERVAHDIFLEKSARNYGQNIRRWADFYRKNLFLPPVVRGHNQKIRPMLCENDVQEQCRCFLQTLNPRQIGVVSLKRFLEKRPFSDKND